MWTGSQPCFKSKQRASGAWLAWISLLCLIAWSPSQAQYLSESASYKRCAPFERSASSTGEVIEVGLTDPAGPYLIWRCHTAEQVAGHSTWHCIADSWANVSLRMLGDRSDTIRLAADPVGAFHASYARHVKTANAARCLALLDREPAKVN